MRASRQSLLVASSAVAYGLAFSHERLVVVGWLSVGILCAVLIRSSARTRAAAAGALLWSAIATTCVAGWLPAMISGFFHLPSAVSVAIFAAVIIIGVAPYYMAFALWLRWRASVAPVAPATVGLAWAALEYARANLWIADPWALLAYSQMPWPSVVQIADLGGPYVLSGLMAAVGASFASPFVPALRQSGCWARLLPFALLAAALAYGANRMQAFAIPGTSERRAAAVQPATPPAERLELRAQPQIERRLLALTREALADGARLVAWPELALLPPVLHSPDTIRRLSELSYRSGADLLVGSSTLDADDAIRNSYFLFREGRLQGRYDKVRLMPFSETNPLPVSIARDAGYAAGSEPVLLETSLGRAGIVICSEGMHPSFVRDVVARGAEYLVNPSVDDWFRSDFAARQQLDAVRFRAIEQRRDILRPASGGFTTVIDATGAFAPPLGRGEPGFVAGSVQARGVTTVYGVVGDLFSWGAAAWIAFDAIRQVRRRRMLSAR